MEDQLNKYKETLLQVKEWMELSDPIKNGTHIRLIKSVLEDGSQPLSDDMLQMHVRMVVSRSFPNPNRVTETDLNTLVDNMMELIKSLKSD
jgi:hypothetical protein